MVVTKTERFLYKEVEKLNNQIISLEYELNKAKKELEDFRRIAIDR